MPNLRRRDFLKAAGFAPALHAAERPVAIVADPADTVAASAPARWAAGELRDALAARGIAVRLLPAPDPAVPGLTIVAAGPRAAIARQALAAAGVAAPAAPEALVLLSRGSTLLACGKDARGLVYALLELADRVACTPDPLAALDLPAPVAERPANVIRGVNRAFTSVVEDTPWFHDRAMWPKYLSMVAAQRFNRFSFTTGIGYDFERDIRDSYFYFAYPFLVKVPGYDVEAGGLAPGERERNLESLRYIGEQAALRGLQFQLGLWTHSYAWGDSGRVNHPITGLSAANHAAYCRDALHAVLEAVPAITGVTFRVHGESGVAEDKRLEFWKTVFDGILRTRRRIEIDMHAKGMDARMMNVALATGLPVNISPKYWAEHLGLPYHQAAIRDLEMPDRQPDMGKFFALSSGSRSFLRYGYGDLLAEDRRYGVWHRVWPGTQKLLLWGDPATAAGYGRAFSFCGSAGGDLCEPLYFKGRQGSGVPGGRQVYADKSLTPAYDWEKYLYTYRLWGRCLYNPDTRPEVWRRWLNRELGRSAPAAEAGLAAASRVLPLITACHGLSGSNAAYWPEMYTNMPIVDAGRKHHYFDTPEPKRFAFVSPFDPEMFSRMADHVDELLEDRPGWKYSPALVAQWLESLGDTATRNLEQAAAQADTPGPAFRRIAVDAAIESGIARFFAWKFRSAMLYTIHEKTGDRAALAQALAAYRKARQAWAVFAARAGSAYVTDIRFGRMPWLQGHWANRLPAIDQDIADMEQKLAGAKPLSDARAAKAIAQALQPAPLPGWEIRHTPPAAFRPGQALRLEVESKPGVAVILRYRRVNQSEQWREAAESVIPAEYTASPYPLEYYFVLRAGGRARIWPGFNEARSNQPYFVVVAQAVSPANRATHIGGRGAGPAGRGRPRSGGGRSER